MRYELWVFTVISFELWIMSVKKANSQRPKAQSSRTMYSFQRRGT